MSSNRVVESEIELLKDTKFNKEDQENTAKSNTLKTQQSQVVPEKKKIFFGQSFAAAIFFGISSFLSGLLTEFNLTTVFLNFQGIFCVSLGYKLLEAKYNGGITLRNIYNQYFGLYYDLDTKKLNVIYLLNVMVRVMNQFCSFFFTVKSIHFSILSETNFGIVTSCFASSIIIASISGKLFFQESFSLKAGFGIIMIIVGIVWISIEKGSHTTHHNGVSELTDDEKTLYKIFALMFAVGVGVSNATQTIHSKILLRMYKYQPMRIVSDAHVLFVITGFIVTIVNYMNDDPSVTSHNALVAFSTSLANGICMMLSMNAMTKGLAGPAGAILYTQNFYCTGLQIIFQGLVPTFPQFIACVISFCGIVTIMLFK